MHSLLDVQNGLLLSPHLIFINLACPSIIGERSWVFAKRLRFPCCSDKKHKRFLLFNTTQLWNSRPSGVRPPGGGRGFLPIMGYTERIRPKRVLAVY